jgi:hypothetical protein
MLGRRGTEIIHLAGVGYNTPGIIRFPFERIAARYRRTHLVRMNRDYPESELLKDRFLPFTEDISMIFKRLTL